MQICTIWYMCNALKHQLEERKKERGNLFFLFRDRVRELLILGILLVHPVGDVRRNALFQIRRTLHGLAPDRETRHDARPHPLPHARVRQILAVLARRAGPDLGARAADLDAQDAGASQLRRVGVAGVCPA